MSTFNLCLIHDCDRPAAKVHLCSAHYKRLTRGKKGGRVETQESLPVADAYSRLPAPPPLPSPAVAGQQLPALMPSRTEVLLTQLQENSRNNPEVWANILRGWLTEEEPS